MVKKISVVFYTMLGHLFTIVGIIGIAVPVLPTTPFIILAFVCYLRGSMRFRKKMLRHKTFGPLIKNWSRYGVIPLRAKGIAVVMIVLSISLSMYIVPFPLVQIALMLTGLGVSVYIITRPSEQGSRKKVPT